MKKQVVLIALGAVLLKVAILFFAYHAVATAPGVHAPPDLCTWDCVYYREIATTGYRETPTTHGPMAFFPAFPLLVGGIVRGTGLGFAPAAIVMNLLLFGVAVGLVVMWAQSLGLRWLWLAPLLWTCDRFTLWSQVPYTEALFCVVVLSFVLLRRHFKPERAERFYPGAALAVAFVAGAASAVRIVGLGAIAAHGSASLRGFVRRPLWGALCLLVGIWGVAAFFAYLQVDFGSWRLSLDTTSHWNRHFSLPGFFYSLVFLLRSMYLPTVPVMIAAAWVIVRPPREWTLEPAERILFALLIFIPMASTIQISLTRYMSVVVLGHLALAWFFEKRLTPWARYRTFWTTLLVVFCASEVVAQVLLTMKYFRAEVFQWAG